MLATTFESMAIPFGITAGVALLGWLVVLAAISVANRPNSPEPVSAGLELGGDSPPAVVAMLTHRWKPNPVGASATLIDLAARDLVRFEPMAAGGFQVRLPDRPPPPDLLDYEAHVLELARSRATNGVAPCDALQVREKSSTWSSTRVVGSKRATLFRPTNTNWFKRFDQMVAVDARRRGLTRSRFSNAATTLIAAAAAVPALFVSLAVAAVPHDASATDCTDCAHASDHPLLGAVFIGLLFWAGLMLLFRLLDEDRGTPTGVAEASRWLGLRSNLRNDPVFSAQHVDGVAVWDRLLAFGVALGVAVVAAADVPISAESKQEAWSAESGLWRLVHIDYPKHLPPGYGGSTAAVFVTGILHLLVAGFVLLVGVSYLVHTAGDLASRSADFVLELIATFLAVVAVLWLGRALAMLWFAGNDFGKKREVEGLVLRSYAYESNDQSSWEAAVDDGTSDHVRAWRGKGQLPAALKEGNRVRATITRHLCTFNSAEVVPPPPPPPPHVTTNPTGD